MSLGAKTVNKGGTKASAQTAKSNKTDKTQRSGRAASETGVGEEVDISKRVKTLMDATCRPEDEVCSALHDCDNDLEKACDLLLEQPGLTQGQWQTNEKKKKKSSGSCATAASGTGTDRDGEGWPAGDKTGAPSGITGSGAPYPREHRAPSRGRSSGRPYRGRGGDSHAIGEEGAEGSSRGGGARRGPTGRGGGRGGGRGASRGGRGSRPPRGPRHAHGEDGWNRGSNLSGQQNTHIDGWGDSFPSPDDWDNEEWSGSLADTKVFTPSSIIAVETAVGVTDVASAPQINSSDQSIHNSLTIQQDADFTKQSNSSLSAEAAASPPPSITGRLTQDPAIYAYTNSSHLLPKAQSPVTMSVSGTLSAAQSQYLSQLTQKSEAMKQDQRGAMLNSQVFSSTYGVYGTSEISNQRKPVQRARVPPPSQIPASAVEMPGELGSSSICSLDVQFGALDFGPETSSFLTDGVASSTSSSVPTTDKFSTTPTVLDHSLSESGSSGVTSQQAVSLDSHQTSTNSASMSNDVSAYSTNTSRTSQLLSSESLSVVSGEQNVSGSNTQYGSTVRTAPPSVSTPHATQLTVSGLESQLKSTGVSDLTQQSTYSTYPGQVTPYGVSQPAKQAYLPHHGYPGNPYSQVNSSGTSFTAATSIASVSAYPPTNTINQYQHVSHTQPINNYQNSSSVSVYGGSGLYQTSGLPYSNYQTLQSSNSNKISSNAKESQYDSTVTTTNTITNSQSASTQSSSKMTSSGKSSASTSVMNSGSAGAGGHVGAVVGQYIMGQHFYTQQPMPAYTYEDVQLIQRPHLQPYYDVGYGSGGSGSGAGARDAPLAASFGSLGTGTADSRFGRAEAPSPQAVAGGGAGAGAAQPPQAGIAPYAYYAYAAGMLPASFQPYSTQPMYPIATAGGTGSSSYGASKGVGVGGAGAAYVGGAGGVAGTYGTPTPAGAPPPQGYESVQQQQPAQQQQINSHQQDYKSSGGYPSTQQATGIKQVNNSSSATADLNNAMYGGKGHVSLSKVNSYDKAYHSATPPPPFGLGAAAGVATVGASGYGPQLYIPHPAIPPQTQQHQMEGRVSNNHRRDNGTNNSRGGATGQNKQGAGAKQGYSPTYWSAN